MISNEQIIRNYLSRLGLEPEIGDIYLALYAHGPQAISELSRTSGVERTRIYRLMDELKRSTLVEVEFQYKRAIFRAAPISNLRLLVSQKEQEWRTLQAELPAVEAALAPSSLTSSATRVQFYQGPEGLKQMYWNETKAKTEVVAILYENMQIRSESAFFERWVRRCNERQMRFRGVIGPHFLASQRRWYAQHDNERLEHWQARSIDPGVFAITHGMVIYDDVVVYQHWRDEEVFGIEIYNAQIAASQRQLFEILWAQGQSVNDKPA
jgi:sugar-specific transcriptional regulator TrmB